MTRFSTLTLQRRVLILALLAVFITGLLVSVAGIWPLARALKQSALDTLTQVYAVQRVSTGQFTRSIADTARQVASRTTIRKALSQHAQGGLSTEALIAYSEGKLIDALNSTPSLRMIARYDKEGSLLLRVGDPIDQQQQINFTTLLNGPEGQLWISAPLLKDDVPYILVASPIQEHPSKPGEKAPVIGYDLLAFGLEDLNAILSQHDGHTTPYRTMIGFGNPNTATPSQWQWLLSQRSADKTHLKPLTEPLPIDLVTPNRQQMTVTSTPQWAYSFAAVGTPELTLSSGPSWYLLVMTPSETLSAPITSVLLRTGLAMLVLMSAVGIGLLLVLRPLQGKLMVHTNDLEEQVKQLQTLGQELAQERERLHQSNQELEQFAYAASHDLQQPLRMVSGFLDALRRQYGDKLDDNAHEFIGFAVDGAQRMRAMITDLLEYSRVGRMETALAPVNLSATVEKAQQMLALAIAEAQAEINVAPLPTVQAIEAQMVRLFQNLLDNALKYQMPGRPPKISITAQQDGNHWIVRVTDNGVGIEAKSLERAFQLFQRLHPNLDCQGTGMGLAMCAKIVSRHQGRIWLESEPEQGTTVCISLPVAPSLAESSKNPPAQTSPQACNADSD